jgi:hypothetical protein
MSWACWRTARLIERRAAGLSEAERLRLEQHVATCSACREQSTLLNRLAELSDRAALSLHPTASSERLIARALAGADRRRLLPEASTVGRARPRFAQLALAFAVLLVLGVVCGSALSRFARTRGPSAAPLASGADSRQTVATVLAGSVFLGERELTRGSPLPEQRELALSGPSEIAVAHAHVRSDAPAEVSWDGAHSLLQLRRGAVDVSVDPAPKRPFSVETARFRVDVMGTEFHVDLRHVRVSRGRVRVLAPDGALLTELSAGQEYALPDAPPSAASATLPDASAAPTVASEPDCKERLAAARHALATGDLAAARRELSSALGQHPSPAQLAEIHMLLGDAARLAGDSARASSEYLSVFQRFPRLPVAEAALFSAARAEQRAGRLAHARELFESYLSHYPSGQFRSQAQESVASGQGGR